MSVANAHHLCDHQHRAETIRKDIESQEQYVSFSEGEDHAM